MATTKKPVGTAAKASAKKPTAKKPAVKKTVEKKSTAKTAAKKPAAKAAAKKPAAKKPVAKTAVKKSAAAKKTAAVKKPAVKSAAKKSAAAPKSAKTSAVKSAKGTSDVGFRNLFDAYAKGQLPEAHGYIVSSFFSEKDAYSIYEVISYAGVKEIYMTGDGLTFVAGGKKLFVLVEPAIYPKKYEEPVHRGEGERIEKRFAELEILTAQNQTKIMVAKEPNELTGSFTVLKPTSINFSTVFYDKHDVYKTLSSFLEESLNRQRKVPQRDAKKAAELIVKTVEKSMSFVGEFQ